MSLANSVRPLVFTNLLVEPDGVEGQDVEGNAKHDLDDVRDLNGRADLADPISGYDVTFKDDTGPGALTIQPLPSPKQPSPAAIARHFLTHLPYAPWCPFCVSFRRPNHHHRRRRSSARLIPLLVGDYAFVRNSRDEVLLTLLVVRLYPSSLLVCMRVRP